MALSALLSEDQQYSELAMEPTGAAAAAAKPVPRKKNLAPVDDKELRDNAGDLVATVGTTLPCQMKDERWVDAEIVHRQINPITNEYEYYVHFKSYNRRLDEWVGKLRLNFAEMTPPPPKAGAAAAAAGEEGNEVKDKKKRDRKRKQLPEAGPDEKSQEEREHEEATKVKNVQEISFGKYVGNSLTVCTPLTACPNALYICVPRYMIDTWYYSPFPEEYNGYHTLHYCEFCLKFFRKREALARHMSRCEQRYPPGDEIYRKQYSDVKISVFEVDGKKNKMYCQNLCFLAKLFLDHKTLYYDVDPFLFYIMCEVDAVGCHIVGYFSKEKISDDSYNLACILSLPPHQRKGYGKFLIQFSYELSKKEERVGTPERPLSDLGLLSYRSYWTQVILQLLQSYKSLAVREISDKTMFRTEDIISTLQSLNLIRYYEGQHIIDISNVKIEPKAFRYVVDASCLRWTPMAPVLSSSKSAPRR